MEQEKPLIKPLPRQWLSSCRCHGAGDPSKSPDPGEKNQNWREFIVGVVREKPFSLSEAFVSSSAPNLPSRGEEAAGGTTPFSCLCAAPPTRTGQAAGGDSQPSGNQR